VQSARHLICRRTQIFEGGCVVQQNRFISSDALTVGGASEDAINHALTVTRGPGGPEGHPAPPNSGIRRIRCTYHGSVAQHALKEWNAVIAAMLAGDQVVMLRKGGIGEKRFDVPHRQFFLLPTHLHQKPELLVAAAREAYADELRLREEPGRNALTAWCEVQQVHEFSEQAALDALDGFHVLGADYAQSRLTWRPTQPLVAMVVRVHRVSPAITIEMTPEMGGCVSWVSLPDAIGAPPAAPVLDDTAFTARAAEVAHALHGLG
jgi:hypothetical protein